MKKQKVIAIIGPTASGKTALGIALAKKFNGEVISADSRQVYKGMDIIASTPSKAETEGVPHHMLRVADPKKSYSAGAFMRAGEKLIAQIAKRGRVPIVVGGTGFYTDALLRGFSLPEVAPNPQLRAELGKKSAEELFSLIKRLDKRRAEMLDPHNKVRLIRAIEIAWALGNVPPLFSNPKHDVLWLELRPPAKKYEALLRTRIRDRFKKGMLAEAKKLRASLSDRRYRALGAEFSLLADHLDGKLSREDLEQKLVQWELKYAKRQLRWFKRGTDTIALPSPKSSLPQVRQFLKS